MGLDALHGAGAPRAGARIILYELPELVVGDEGRHGRPDDADTDGLCETPSVQCGFAGIRFRRSAARRAASLSGYFCVTSCSVLRESA